MQTTSRIFSQTLQSLHHPSSPSLRASAEIVRYSSSVPIIHIKDATFYRRQPSLTPSEDESRNNPPLFPKLYFQVAASEPTEEHWAIIGPSNAGKTTLLEILRGQHLCFPPNGRKFPYLSATHASGRDTRLRYPSNAIQYVGFGGPNEKGLSGIGTYISARYESRREATDFLTLDYLKGNVHLNALETATDPEDEALLEQVILDLKLERLIRQPVNNLSNGQSRRARIAKALLGRPELLLLDEPFMGLDPPTTVKLSPLLHKLAKSRSPRLLLALRPQDPVPEWISHVAVLGKHLIVTHQGKKSDVAKALIEDGTTPKSDIENGESKPSGLYLDIAKALSSTGDGIQDQTGTKPKGPYFIDNAKIGDPVIHFNGVQVKYGPKIVLGDWTQRHPASGRAKKPGLHWTVRKGQRWGLFGANGSGKTTLLSMITSDHPQAYSNPLKVFGRHRLPSVGNKAISLFELQSRIGHSSPEVHAFFPRNLTVRQSLETAYADTPMSRPALTSKDDTRIDACLRWFQAELNPALGPSEFLNYLGKEDGGGSELKGSILPTPEAYRTLRNQQIYEYTTAQAASIEWADNMLFGELSVSAQKVVLFLRAIVKSPELIILDEAFSGLDDVARDKCLLFLEKGETAKIADPNSPLSTQNVKDSAGVRTTAYGKTIHESWYGGGLTENQALIVVSHVKEELPMCIREWIFLPEPGEQLVCQIGRLTGKPLRDNSSKWNEIWGLETG